MQAQDLDPRPRPASFRKSAVLVASVLVIGAGLTSWKYSSLRAAEAAGAQPMEPAEVVTTAPAVQRAHSATTTAIGTVHALRSVTLRNEVAGTVRIARLTPGQIVEPGTVLVALDVSVEEASLRAPRQTLRTRLAARPRKRRPHACALLRSNCCLAPARSRLLPAGQR